MVKQFIILIMIFGFFATGFSSEVDDSAIETAIARTAEAIPTEMPIPATWTSEPSPTDAPNPTETPQPTSTTEASPTPVPSPVPLSGIDLRPIILSDDDLPEHLQEDFFVEGLDAQNVLLGRLPGGEQIVTQKFYNNERNSGGGASIIFLYNDLDLVQDAFDHAAADLTLLNFDADVGEQSKAERNPPQWHLTFTRCHAFVYIFMIDGREFDIVSYAQALDVRLSEAVCDE
jgi:hypothetical protein